MGRVIGIVFLYFLLTACTKEKALFQIVDPDDSGVHFSNDIKENEDFNIINVSYIYNGGGVGIGDFDNNGLSDLIFTGNMVENRLYLNKGNFQFEDVTEIAGVGAAVKWKSGVSIVDINSDGLHDIYVCATLSGDSSMRANMLFVNQGLNENGIPVFKDEASKYGIADKSHSTMAVFFDYDNDLDLDLFILTNSKQRGVPITYRPKVNDGTSTNTDRLYRNNGNGTYTDVTAEAGIRSEGFGLGAAILDVNKDGWLDIYVGNDYITNDLLYLNNKGKFTEVIDKSIKHQSRFSMGNDAADINNDGHSDILTLDMLPETNLRKKTVGGGSGYITYINDERFGYAHQYVRNMLQLSNGDMTFSEVGQLAGVHQTEWSWAPLFADFDNDGYKDLAVTNGFPKDVTDRDFISFREKSGAYTSIDYLLDQIPSVKIPNYVFRNDGNLLFNDVSEKWGFVQPSFSNGAAFADLDNDGDLDFVTNNIGDKAFLYENTIDTKRNFLRVKLSGPVGNFSGIGTKVTIFYDNGKMQFSEHYIGRGYLSSVEDYVHFGLGEVKVVDSIAVEWSGGRIETRTNIAANEVLTFNYDDSKSGIGKSYSEWNSSLLEEVSGSLNILYKHDEIDFIDFNIQRTIPHKFSQYGPGIAVGDINGDELEDFFLGGSKKYQGTFYIQKANGIFERRGGVADEGKQEEDEGVLLFDADNDGDQDLYIVSGSYEHEAKSIYYQDRLLFNDGSGNFRLDTTALPPMRSSGSCVRAADYDRDGDLDLFIGGRVIPGSYPKSPQSYLLENENGKFTDVTPEPLKTVGMVTDALWSDFDNDGLADLIIVGEFMPVQIFKNTEGKLNTFNTGLEDYSGWWNSITSGDFDKDGDVDYVLGNLGENNPFCADSDQPIEVIADDFDDNGRIDAILSCYVKSEDHRMKPFPVHYWNELYTQSPNFRKQFESYAQYASTSTYELLKPEEIENAIHLSARYVSTSYMQNNGNGKFEIRKLPIQAQFAPVNGLVAENIDADDHLDIVMVGNDYGNETNVGQYDAFSGLVLFGDGTGHFDAKNTSVGFNVPGDAKALSKVVMKNGRRLLIASQNKDSLKVFVVKADSNTFLVPDAMDFWAEINYHDGRSEKVELYYGSGFLSQSTRRLSFKKSQVASVDFYSYTGEKRHVQIH